MPVNLKAEGVSGMKRFRANGEVVALLISDVRSATDAEMEARKASNSCGCAQLKPHRSNHPHPKYFSR